ncbi:MAG: 6-bladed beta-propeller [Terriglobia bacterium]
MAEAQAAGADNTTEIEDRRKRNKKLAIILLLLLLAFLVLLFLYLRPLVRPFSDEPLRFLFSVYGFNKPLSVSTDSQKNIYVSDTGNNRLMVFDRDGEYLRRVGKSSGKNKLQGVYGTYIDEKKDRVYVADWMRQRVSVFTDKGRFLFKFPRNGQAAAFGPLGFTPYDLASYKGKMYVTSNNGIYVFTKTGKFLERWGKRGTGIGDYDFPNGIAIDQKSGMIYVADTLNRRVVAIKGKNKIQWTLGRPDQNQSIVSFFALPRDVSVDNEGRVLVTDTFHHQIVVIDKKGALISIVGGRGTDDAKLNFPEGIAVTKDGVVYVADRENGRIQALRLGTLKEPPQADQAEARASYVGPAPPKAKDDRDDRDERR